MEGRDRFGRTPLHLACEHGRLSTVQCLLDCGCKPGAEDKTGRTALHIAACCDEPRVANLLVTRQPQLVARTDVHARSALFYAVLNIHPAAQQSITTLLLDQLAEVNARDSYGMVPLHYAAEEGRRQSVSLLLRRSADACAEDAVDGRTPIQLAKSEQVRSMLRLAAGSRAPSAGRRDAGSGRGAGSAQPQAAVALPAPGASSSASAPAPEAEAAGGPRRASSVGRGGSAAVCKPVMQVAPQAAPALPPALSCVPFRELQARFVRIMERVQSAGVEQMEHVKRPHLFTGSWMADVSSHQQLLGHALKHVPGPEACIRVFNLLRPPAHLPATRGDEKDIIGYYEDGGQQREPRLVWGGVDPYMAAVGDVEDDGGLSCARRVELLRTIHEQRQQLEGKEASIEELRKRGDRLEAELADCLDAASAQALRTRASRAQAQLVEQGEELERARSELKVSEGKVKGLTEQLAEEKDRSATLVAEQCAVRQKLEDLLTQKGEEQSQRIREDIERQAIEAARRKLEQKLQEETEHRNQAEAAANELEVQLRRVQSELADHAQRALDDRSALERDARSMEERLREEIDHLQSDLDASRTSEADVRRALQRQEPVAREALALRAELEKASRLRPELESARSRASALEAERGQLAREMAEIKHERDMWEKLSQVPMVASMFLNPQALGAPSAAPLQAA
eukprot:TRINITY_DN54444_c0_g1_i1.p1 TRINITY_DN54444_c0_g1~~TRINITY_DN54444_c0_g1_i1.p1  ORF type:complete len:762 (-),score=199.71 TRINITY_DN54444_c0_g1_i1:106-2166(-)